VGSGEDWSIADLAHLVAKIVEFRGAIEYDLSKPDGTPTKLLSGDKLKALGWQPTIKLEDGLRQTYASFLAANNR
jgi:GDP-L-fucose synthase